MKSSVINVRGGRIIHPAIPRRTLPVQPTEKIYNNATAQLARRQANRVELMEAAANHTPAVVRRPIVSTGVARPVFNPMQSPTFGVRIAV